MVTSARPLVPYVLLVGEVYILKMLLLMTGRSRSKRFLRILPVLFLRFAVLDHLVNYLTLPGTTRCGSGSRAGARTAWFAGRATSFSWRIFLLGALGTLRIRALARAHVVPCAGLAMFAGLFHRF